MGSCSLPFISLVVLELLFIVGEDPLNCGQTVRTNVLMPGVSRGLGAPTLIEGLGGLGAWPGQGIVCPLALA